jgi:flagellar M-ring protein FliF
VVKYAALLAGLLLIVAFGLRPAVARARSGSKGKEKEAAKGELKELPTHAETAEARALKPPEPVEMDPERIRTQEIFDQVTGHLKREPTQSSRLLQSWIHSD